MMFSDDYTRSPAPRGHVMSNQGDARETAYRNYEAIARSGASKEAKDTAWGEYLAKLAADTGAQQARKLH